MKKLLKSSLMAAVALTAISQSAVQARDINEINNPVELTVRTLGAASGITIGTPIATLRLLPESTSNGIESCAKELSSTDEPDGMQIAFATIPGIAVGMTNGILKGLVTGVKTGAQEGFDNPFSLESFSLGEELEEI